MIAPTEAYPPRLYSWLVVGLLLCTAIMAYTDRQVLSLLVDPVRQDLGITDTQMSLLLGTAFAVVYGMAGIPLGYLSDRRSRRNMIVAGVAIWSVATLWCGMAQNYQQLFGARVLVGLGEAVLSPAAISLISDYFPPSRRGTAVGVFLAGIAIGAGGSILIGGFVLNAVDHGLLAGTGLGDMPAWRLVLLVIGGPGLVWALLLLWIREPIRRTDGDSPAIAASGPEGLAWTRLAPLFVALAIGSLVDNAVGAWSPSLLMRRFGLSPAEVGVTLGLLLMVGFGGGVMAGGVLADRAHQLGGALGKIRLCLISALLILPSSTLLLSRDVNLVLIGVPLYFLLSGVATASGFSAILDRVPNRSRGLAMSISFFLNVALGAGLGPTAVAVAGDHLFGPTAGLGPPIAAVVVAGFSIVACALLLAQRKRFA